MAAKLTLVLLLVAIFAANGQLVPHYYDARCPQLYSIVRAGVERAIQIQQRNAASLLRLFFHDCFVNGCDASILLDDTPSFVGEKTAVPNNQSARGFEFIDSIKLELEKECPSTVSCADTLAIIARDAVVLSGGPSWQVSLGRRDSLSASRSAANKFIPPPTNDLPALISSFNAVGLDTVDLVSLAGSHTIGFSRCTSFTQRIYNQSGTLKPEANITPDFLRFLQTKCPQNGNPNVLQPLDWATPAAFDNHYYKNLVVQMGLLHSDESLYTMGKGVTAELVEKFSIDIDAFYASFAKSMIKMGNIKPLTGNKGEIRTNCRKRN